jgi:hypothetical protein
MLHFPEVPEDYLSKYRQRNICIVRPLPRQEMIIKHIDQNTSCGAAFYFHRRSYDALSIKWRRFSANVDPFGYPA